MWFELLRAGFTQADVQSVIRYLQREIRHGRRNVGALKLSNLLPPDHFEEELNISRVTLSPPKPSKPAAPTAPSPTPEEREAARLRGLPMLARLRAENSR